MLASPSKVIAMARRSSSEKVRWAFIPFLFLTIAVRGASFVERKYASLTSAIKRMKASVLLWSCYGLYPWSELGMEPFSSIVDVVSAVTWNEVNNTSSNKS